MKTTAFSLGLGLMVGLVAALASGQARVPFTKVTGVNINPSSLSVSGVADQFVCTATSNVCEVESSINAATMTSTVPGFDIGPIATPDANDRLACFSYGASGSKTRVVCVDTEGDVAASGGFNSAVAANGNAFTCTTAGCRLSLGSTSRYIYDNGSNFQSNVAIQSDTNIFTPSVLSGGGLTVQGNSLTVGVNIKAGSGTARVADFTSDTAVVANIDGDGNITGNSCNASATSGNSFTGGNASASLVMASNTTDAVTTTTVAAIRMQAAQDITSNDLIFSVQDSAGNIRYGLREDGLMSTSIHTVGSIQADDAFTANGRFLRPESSISIPSNGAGTPAAYTWAPAAGRSVIYFTCDDSDGCDVTMSETGAGNARHNRAVNVGTNTLTFTDTAGVNEMAGNFTMGQWDVLEFVYVTDRFVELLRSNN